MGLWRESYLGGEVGVCAEEGVISNTSVPWAGGAMGVWSLPFLSAAALPFQNLHPVDKSLTMPSL